MKSPQHLITTSFEPREGYQFNQPVERLNGKSYFEYDEDSYERKNWGVIRNQSRLYNAALDYSLFHSDLWTNEQAKEKAFDVIYEYISKRSSASAVTPLFPFEIYMLNDGFELTSFCELNATQCTARCYYKDGVQVYLGFGFENTNFYFKTSNSSEYFQVDNTKENYTKAIEGKLNPIPKL